MKTTLEGKGIYAGNWTFVLSMMGGALGGTSCVCAWFADFWKHEMLSWDALLKLFTWGAEGVSVGTAVGAAVGLMVGSTAARSFYVMFCAAVGTVVAFAPAIVLELNPAWQSTEIGRLYEEYLTEIEALLVGGGLVIGAWLMRDCVGFSSRARRRARIGFAWMFVGAGGVGLWSATMLPVGVRLEELAIQIAIASLAIGLVGAIGGAMCGPDRDNTRGFAVLGESMAGDASVGEVSRVLEGANSGNGGVSVVAGGGIGVEGADDGDDGADSE